MKGRGGKKQSRAKILSALLPPCLSPSSSPFQWLLTQGPLRFKQQWQHCSCWFIFWAYRPAGVNVGLPYAVPFFINNFAKVHLVFPWTKGTSSPSSFGTVALSHKEGTRAINRLHGVHGSFLLSFTISPLRPAGHFSEKLISSSLYFCRDQMRSQVLLCHSVINWILNDRIRPTHISVLGGKAFIEALSPTNIHGYGKEDNLEFCRTYPDPSLLFSQVLCKMIWVWEKGMSFSPRAQ